MEVFFVRTVAFFNNKGGVGKTTIATTVGYELSRKGKKVLMIDLDPQSNTTQVVLNDAQVERIYKKSSNIDRIKTIKDVYNPMRDSNEPEIGNVKESILSGEKHGFKFDILPSNLNLSEFEDTLSDAWSDLRANKLGGFRRTNWFIQLEQQIKSDYDYVLLDLSPSLGALNRSVLLNVDFFIIPITGDIYNVYGIQNIGRWISQWIRTYTRSLSYLKDDYDAETLNRSQINLSLKQENFKKFAGYIVSRAKYSKKTSGIISYQKKHISDIKKMIHESLYFATVDNIELTSLELGEIREIMSLLTESQGEHVPSYKRVAEAEQNHKKWDKRSAQNAEYAIMKTFEQITTNLLINVGDKNDTNN